MIKNFHWGWRISLVYLGFAAMILTLVYCSSREKIELVTTDYYQKEVAYQGIIDAHHNTMEAEAFSQLDITQNRLKIKFPAPSKQVNKKVLIYHVSESDKDQSLHTTEDSVYIQMQKGKYKIQIQWNLNSKDYWEEKTIQIK